MSMTRKEISQDSKSCLARAKMIRGSAQKLNLLAQMIRGKSAQQAVSELTFSPKRVAKEVLKVLQSAIANAENNKGLDIDALKVNEAYVGKALVMKRFRARARGRGAKILKPYSNLTIIVTEEN